MEQELLQAIQSIVTKAVNEAVTASEDRMMAAMAEQIANSENRMRAYFEKSVDMLVDGHKMLAEKINRIDVRKDLDEMKGSLAVIESAVTRNTTSIIELQKAKG